MVIQDLDVGYALETQTRPFFDGVPDDSTLVHELAHQWYGDSVTPRDWGDIWLNEGFATYAEANWAAEHGGPSTWQAFQKTYDANDASSDLWTPAPNALEDPADLFGESRLHPRRADARGPAAPDRRREDEEAAAHVEQPRGGRSRCAPASSSRWPSRSADQDLGWFFRSWLEVASKPAGY